MSVFPSNLKELVGKTFDAAVKNKDALFFESELVIQTSSQGIPYEVRYAPALAKKPTNLPSKTAAEEQPKPSDPFGPPYQMGLFICHGKDNDEDEEEADRQEYVLVLNKFCVTPRHTILATRDWRPQNQLVSLSELYTLYSLLLDQNFGFDLAFYNCGDHSGASQPHKHFQLLPLDHRPTPFQRMIESFTPPRKGAVFSLPWEVAPYSHYIVQIDDHQFNDMTNITEKKDFLMNIYLSLLDRAHENIRHLQYEATAITHNDRADDADVDGYIVEGILPDNPMPRRASELSYNLILTRRYMKLVPRKCEKAKITPSGSTHRGDRREEKRQRLVENANCENITGPDAADPLVVSVNSLGYAGMVLAKTPEERDALAAVGVTKILGVLGWENGLVDDENAA